MAEILGLGMSHYPGFYYLDADMNRFLVDTLRSQRVPAEMKDPKSWPAPMQAEWGDDRGATFASKHRAQFVQGVRKLRQALDDFRPEVVVIFGDDQYENFREDLIAPFAVYIMPEFEITPFALDLGREPKPNVWGEPVDKRFRYPGQPEAARYLATQLLERRFDVSYGYKLHHLPELGHAFRNTLLYLDFERRGWSYPIVPFHVNAYGSSIVRNRGGLEHLLGATVDFPDPPAPSPARCFELGQAVAQALAASPWRAAIVGSSSWSHAFLTEKHHWIYPDVAADRRRFEELKAGNYTAWRDLTLAEVEDAGQHEILNWTPLLGAMHELGRKKPSMCEFLESYVMNSCKCLALFPPD